MDHPPSERRDPLKRDVEVSDGEVGQRTRVARAGTALVNSEHRSPAAALPASTLGVAALRQFDAEQTRPEATRAFCIISRELDQTERSIHAANDNGARPGRGSVGRGRRFEQFRTACTCRCRS